MISVVFIRDLGTEITHGTGVCLEKAEGLEHNLLKRGLQQI